MLQFDQKILSRAKVLAPVLAALLLAVVALSPHGQDADAYALYTGDAYAEEDALTSPVLLTNSSSQLVSRSDGRDLVLTAGDAVSITYQGETLSTVAQMESVGDLLSRLDIVPSPLEMVAVDFEENAVDIQVSSELIFYDRVSSVTEHETVYRYNDKLPSWSETVIQNGVDGAYTEVYEVVYQDGEETSRQLIDVEETAPTPTIIEKGTIENFASNSEPVASINTNADGSGTITLENGAVLTFNSTKSMKGTAYTSNVGKVGTVTASGTTARVGVIAVDKSVIPLGTKVYIVSNDGAYVYGFAVAEDTGVKGNHVDLFMDTYSQCIQFGSRQCTVYILD
jgi:3D (Asp-Asp-Asp) domain-containing protein